MDPKAVKSEQVLQTNMGITCYECLQVASGREEGDLHDVPVAPPLHPVLQERERLLAVFGVGDGHLHIRCMMHQ